MLVCPASTIIFMLWPKKNSYKEFDDEKKFPSPHNFSNGPSLIKFLVFGGQSL